MNSIKIVILLALCSFTSLNYSQFTDDINSNRPGKSSGAFAVGKNVYQLESGIYGIKESHSLLNYDAMGFGAELTFRAGLLKEQLEFSLDTQLQLDSYTYIRTKKSRAGLRNLTLGAKYLFYDPFKGKEDKPNIYSWKANHQFFKWKQLIPVVAGYVGVNYVMDNDYNIPGESAINPRIVAIAQNHFGPKWVLVTNLVADKISSIAFNYGYVMTLTYGINPKWSAFVENQAIKGKYYSDGILTGGATFLYKKNIQLDASISKNIKDTPSLLYGGIGLSWRFDKKYKDIKMKDGKEVKDEIEELDKENRKKKKKKKKGGELTQEELDDEAKKIDKKKKKEKDYEPEKEIKRERIDNLLEDE